MDFYDIVDREFLPAIKAGDNALATRIVNDILAKKYAVHRNAIDKVVTMSTDQYNAAEKHSTELQSRLSLVMLATAFGVVLAKRQLLLISH